MCLYLLVKAISGLTQEKKARPQHDDFRNGLLFWKSWVLFDPYIWLEINLSENFLLNDLLVMISSASGSSKTMLLFSWSSPDLLKDGCGRTYSMLVRLSVVIDIEVVILLSLVFTFGLKPDIPAPNELSVFLGENLLISVSRPLITLFEIWGSKRDVFLSSLYSKPRSIIWNMILKKVF